MSPCDVKGKTNKKQEKSNLGKTATRQEVQKEEIGERGSCIHAKKGDRAKRSSWRCITLNVLRYIMLNVSQRNAMAELETQRKGWKIVEKKTNLENLSETIRKLIHKPGSPKSG